MTVTFELDGQEFVALNGEPAPCGQVRDRFGRWLRDFLTLAVVARLAVEDAHKGATIADVCGSLLR